ncbi:MAG: SpoIIE family protein phosphatase [Bacteroidales bacterium]|nr:SpoIIE family protein phosphatase [Bacteroidales bacterium]
MKKIITRFNKYDFSNQGINQIFAVSFFFFAGIISLLFFFIRGLIYENVIYNLIVFLFIVCSVTAFLFTNYTKKIRIGAWSVVIIMFFLEYFLLFKLTKNNLGFIWYFLYPVLSIFTLKKWEGIIMSLILIISTILCFVVFDYHRYFFSNYFILRFSSGYFSIMLLVYIYETVFNKTQNDFIKERIRANEYQFRIENINEELQSQNQIIETKNKQLEEAGINLAQSITYAQVIQSNLLPNKKMMKSVLDKYFILFKPLEKISGDFYYVNRVNEYNIFAVGDCTGHGIPGGLLSVLSITLLHEIIRRKEANDSGKVLNLFRNRIKSTFSFFSDKNFHGLDIAFVAIDTKKNILYYAGANIPMFLYSEAQITQYKCTRNPIGFYYNEQDFKNYTIQLKNNNIIYLATDGVFDQIGGENNKKISKKGFVNIIQENAHLPIDIQENKFEKSLNNWKKNNLQIDDITLLAVEWNTNF